MFHNELFFIHKFSIFNFRFGALYPEKKDTLCVPKYPPSKSSSKVHELTPALQSNLESCRTYNSISDKNDFSTEVSLNQKKEYINHSNESNIFSKKESAPKFIDCEDSKCSCPIPVSYENSDCKNKPVFSDLPCSSNSTCFTAQNSKDARSSFQPNATPNCNLYSSIETHTTTQGLPVPSSVQTSVQSSTSTTCVTSQNSESRSNLANNGSGDTSMSFSVPNASKAPESSTEVPLTTITYYYGAVPKIAKDPPFCTKETRSSSFDQTSSFVKDSRFLSDQVSSIAIDSNCSRKASLPLTVSEPEVSASNPELWMLSGPVRTFARCGRNSVPRITYSKTRDANTISAGSDGRPIYPSLPFSPYCSPNSSPRLIRHQPKESRKVVYECHSDYEQLNHYRLKGEIGQVSFPFFLFDFSFIKFIVFYPELCFFAYSSL